MLDSPMALFLVRSASDRLMRSLFDDTFAGIHQMAWFDWAMLIPYFTILIILSVYGIHRYDIIRTYFKHRKKRHRRTAQTLRAAAAGHHPASSLQRAVRGGAAD